MLRSASLILTSPASTQQQHRASPQYQLPSSMSRFGCVILAQSFGTVLAVRGVSLWHTQRRNNSLVLVHTHRASHLLTGTHGSLKWLWHTCPDLLASIYRASRTVMHQLFTQQYLVSVVCACYYMQCARRYVPHSARLSVGLRSLLRLLWGSMRMREGGRPGSFAGSLRPWSARQALPRVESLGSERCRQPSKAARAHMKPMTLRKLHQMVQQVNKEMGRGQMDYLDWLEELGPDRVQAHRRWVEMLNTMMGVGK